MRFWVPLIALVALPADHERDPAGAVEDPHPFVDRAGQGDEAVHRQEVVVRRAQFRWRLTRKGARLRVAGAHRGDRFRFLAFTPAGTGTASRPTPRGLLPRAFQGPDRARVREERAHAAV